ncbi:LysR family transcriptional regulator [Secundilactobacillus paracollinoides]|uniref:LysR family transcriptional regulator n=1 Tax=Secundilactobacillus paracollinoides TaxID=240427 RepID=A0A1B2IXV6_9LACO|nr:LysR family transcriptional regulator [Secundilactobacillus paracollinoides]ANZ66906.1 LysR family transcriptional regulator [Secundilactobacillus paracollinoides]
METHNLRTFISVVESGSFTKTAEQNFISSTAVMKQINRLENELETQLFIRFSTGVDLTPSGKVFRKYAEEVIKLTDDVYADCHKADGTAQTIRLGTSLLHPSAPFMQTWHRIKAQVPNYQLQITQLSNDLTASNREYAMLGRDFDIMIGTFDRATTRSLVQAIPLGTYQFGIAVRSDNPLATQAIVSIGDLQDQTLLMVPNGVSEKNDQLLHEILRINPNISINYTTGRYDINVFNKAVNDNSALISLTPWENIHPNLVFVPLKTSIQVEYGILAAKTTDMKVQNFINLIRHALG